MVRDTGHVRAFRLSAEVCPIPAAINLIGERWAFLILRGALLGLRHFEEFQSCLGIARNILSDRLGGLVEAGVLARTPDPHDRRKIVYALTDKGAGLLPVLVAIRQWGLDFGMGGPSHPVLSDRRDGQPLARLSVQAHDGRNLSLEDLVWIGPDGEHLPLPLPARAGREAA